MYQVNLTKERMQVHVAGLDAAVRLIAQQISNHQSSGAALKQLLPQLIKLDQEFEFLQEIVNGQDQLEEMTKKSSEAVKAESKAMNGSEAVQ